MQRQMSDMMKKMGKGKGGMMKAAMKQMMGGKGGMDPAAMAQGMDPKTMEAAAKQMGAKLPGMGGGMGLPSGLSGFGKKK
jgi:signal recognition particle subunit SRP54